jgi:tRNA (guanine37-N1)-methyltransferase
MKNGLKRSPLKLASNSSIKFHLITLFQEACDAYLNASILGRARKERKIEVKYVNPRDFAPTSKSGSRLQKGVGIDKWVYRKVDERPYGGGPGMVITAPPIIKAVQKTLGKKYGHRKFIIVWFSPSAKQFTNKDADALLKKYTDVVLVCGRYEGIDERAKKILKTLAPLKEFAVGEAVLTGGEVPAMAIVDAMTRRIPGVLGKDASVEERRIAPRQAYTRPEVIKWKGKSYRVPPILKTGHHAKIDAFRKKK